MKDDFDWSWYPAESDNRLHARIKEARSGNNREGRKVLRDCIGYLRDSDPLPVTISTLIERLERALAARSQMIAQALGIKRPLGRPKQQHEPDNRREFRETIQWLRDHGHENHELGKYTVEILERALCANSKTVGAAMRISPPRNRPVGTKSLGYEPFTNWRMDKLRQTEPNDFPSNEQLVKEFLKYLVEAETPLDPDQWPEDPTVRNWVGDCKNLTLLKEIDRILTETESE